MKTPINYSKKEFNLLAGLSFFSLLFILPLVACPLWGQVVQKKLLTPSDYQLWAETHLDKISPDENWVSYTTAYQNGSDTLFLRNSVNGKAFFYAGAANSIFTKNNYFICRTANNLHILNLKTFRQQTISDVLKYDFCAVTNRLIFLTKHLDNSSLLIKSMEGDAVKDIQNAADFSISPKGRYVIYSTLSNNESTLNLLDLEKPSAIKCLSLSAGRLFTTFTWQRHGLALAYLKQSPDLSISSLFYYSIKNEKLFEFIPDKRSDFPEHTSIYWDPFYKILISDDLQSVFFSVKKNADLSPVRKESDVEIWNANDKWIYPQQQKNGNFNTSPKIGIWLAKKNIFKQITTPELPKVMLTGNLENAILFNPLHYEPQFEDEGPSDYYIMNLKTFEKHIFLKKQEGHKRTVLPSPSGRFIAYFKENNWWIYDIILKSHKNITAKTGIKFTAKNQMLAPESVCGSPGWSLNDDEFLIYDQYDIWAAKTDGNSLRRLTHGRESKIILRIADNPNHIGLDYIYDGSKTSSFNLDKTVILKGHGEDEKTGYFKLIPGFGQKPIVYKESFIDELNYGAKKDKFFFREQRFNLSPEIKATNKNSENKTVFKSNPQQEKYRWGRSELVTYQNSKKQDLKAVLIYPADYNPLKKYSMIVNIYEIQSKELHTFSRPSLYNENGFNATVFSAEGYFVLMPDILLEQGNPGVSAADCVISATRQIIGTGMVDPRRIGLMGHSFGGYETAFIVTQTDLFAAAIPSGAITDLTSFYFNVNQNSGEPDMWRFQSEQWNMRKTPFEAPLSYSTNSPIVHAQKITSPLLIWSGKEDQQVNSNQSLEFYLAMRRLGKKSIMLLYPQEGHVITSTENQKDITARILQWFDYFLKNKNNKSSLWITDGTLENLE